MNNSQKNRTARFVIVLACAASLTLTGCGTLTGIPAHGGGKRFATEQRLVSASIRAALMDIDLTPIRGKKAALIFDLVADEGGGSFNGGRWSPGLLFSVGTMTSPVTTTTNAFQVYNLAESGSSYNNTSSSGGSTSVSTTLQSGTSTNTGVSGTNGSYTDSSSGSSTGSSSTSGSSSSTGTNSSTGTSTSTGTNTSTGTSSNTSTSSTNGSSTANNSTTSSGTSSGSSTSTTGGTTTNTNYNQTDNGTSTTIGSGTSTSTTNGSGSSSSTSSGTSTSSGSNSSTGTSSSSGTNSSNTTSSANNTSNANGTNTSNSQSSGSGTSNGQSTTTTTSRDGGSSHSSGAYSGQHEALPQVPTETQTVTKGTKREHTATLSYRGLGEYQNFNVPKSDASLLMGLVRNYMLLNGVTPTTPNDPKAEVLVYVTVDIFGTVRSRFDALLYNNETVKAETSFEIMAFDREGNNIVMRPQVSNREARYREHYLLWTGPLTSQEQVYQGQGLLVDFTKVDGTKGKYNSAAPVEREFPGGKN